MTSHFDSIASDFNELWLFSDQYRNWITKEIATQLQFNETDILVDIGGGTGLFTNLLKETTPVKKVFCVEPSKEMYLEAKKIKNICAINENCADFLQLHKEFSKILFKEVVHHIQNRPETWEKVFSLLPSRGKLLIVTRPKNTTLPLFRAAFERFAENQPSEQELLVEFDTTNFILHVEQKAFSFEIKKDTWINMIRHRFISDLQNFTSDEIEEGVQEIQHQYPENIISAQDTLLFILAKKL
jgi:trans-aconitate methyltransferase